MTSKDTERLVRLLRAGRQHDLSATTRETIRAWLLAALDRDDVSARPAAPAPRGETVNGPKPGAKAQAVQEPLLAASPEQLELRIRQMAQAEAPWVELRPLALDLLAKRPTREVAARLTELVFLSGSSEDAAELLGRGRQLAGEDFYRLVHPAVRGHLTLRLWRDEQMGGLVTLLFRDRDEDYLIPLERLCVFASLASGKDPATPYMYFRRFKLALKEAAREWGEAVGLAEPAIMLAAGRLAVTLGHGAEAQEILSEIPEHAAEREDALRLLLNIAAAKNRAGMSHYAELLVAESDPAGRLRLMADFLAATRGLGGFRDQNRPALNELLSDPRAWLTAEPEVLATLSQLLVANRDLEPLLPNLFELFRQQATRFDSPQVEQAIWEGPASANAATPRDRYWRGVALLHHYVACGTAAEAKLWEARELVEASRRRLEQPAPFAWRDLHKAAYAWASRSHYLLEPDRVRMLEQLRVAVEGSQVAVSDVEEYLRHAEAPPVSVLDGLQELIATKNAPALEAKVILKRAAQSHLTNADLSRLWHLANARKDADLAWRVATVLHSRQALASSVRHAWEISGEKRAHYPLQTLSQTVLERCLRGLPQQAARLGHAVAHIGPLLPELLAILDPGASIARVAAPPADSVEANVEKALAAVPWLGAAKRRYRFSQDAAAGATSLPAFAQVLPANPWSILVARLSERFGCNAFGYRLSRLAGQIEGLIPRLASRQDMRRHSGKVAKWLKDLTPAQRSAWQDLATLARSMTDGEAADALAVLVTRLATIILPNHLMALTSLHAMRAPVSLVWGLETFLLGETYSELRRQQGLANRVLVPNSLQRLAEVHAEVR